MADASIKPTTQDDIPALQVVLDQTGLFPAVMLPDMFGHSLSNGPDALWLTCHLDGAAVGFCCAIPEELTDGTWNLLALAVRPDLQGKGLGSRLVAAVEETLRARAGRILIVDTSGTDDFALTRQFYRRIGYDEEARIRDFWSTGDDKVIFRKAL